MNTLTDIKKTLFLLLSKDLAKATPLGELKDKVIIITGASKGIGKATVEYLYAEGCKVVAVSRNLDVLQKEFPNDKFPNLLPVVGDVTQSISCQNVISETIKHYGKIDVLINNAAVFLEKPLVETTPDEIDTMIDTDVKGALYMSRAAIPFMGSPSTIINIGSKISHNQNIAPNKVLYAASKYAIEGMSYALNKELKSKGIRVVCVMPGTVNTFISLKAGNYMSPVRVAQMLAMVIKFHDLDFEGFVFKSTEQEI